MMRFLTELDVSIFRVVNGLCGWNPTLDRVVVHHEDFRIPLFMGIFGWLWYLPGKEMQRRRETLITMVFALVLSLVVNRIISMLVPFRVRPMYSIGANAPSLDWQPNFEHWSSFPSDQATYLFGIAAGFWLISKWWGLGFALFAVLGSMARVFLGIHYPSDILVGALLGIAGSLAINRDFARELIARPLLTLEVRYPAQFYTAFFITLAELAGTFGNTRHIAVAIVHFLTGYNR
jgi:undecaprenyl-diphosphatase